MFRAPKIALSLVLVLVAGTLISACGEDRSHLLPGENVKEISANLDTVQRLVDEGECFTALRAAGEIQNQAEALPRTVDPKLKRSLIDGVVTLTILVGRQCEDDPSLTTTDETQTEVPETEVTPTGDTGVTPEDEETGTTGKKDKQQSEETTKPSKPEKEKKPAPEKTPPATPTTPPPTTPPAETGPGSGGISPNP